MKETQTTVHSVLILNGTKLESLIGWLKTFFLHFLNLSNKVIISDNSHKAQITTQPRLTSNRKYIAMKLFSLLPQIQTCSPLAQDFEKFLISNCSEYRLWFLSYIWHNKITQMKSPAAVLEHYCNTIIFNGKYKIKLSKTLIKLFPLN